jgi:aryl-alcohol dehydrogenase-like predicted oxidoreductase
MEYRELGRTGVKVGALCLGTMTYGEQNTEAEGHEQMDYALAEGINIFDAAETSGPGWRAARTGTRC